MRVKPIFDLQDSHEWDCFVGLSNSGTIFHKLRFLQYHPAGRFNFFPLVFYKNSRIIAVLPAAFDKEGFLKSPSGASYGSFATDNLEFGEYEELIDCLIDYCTALNLRGIQLTPPPSFYLKSASELESFILSYKGFIVKHHLISNAVDLTNFSADSTLGFFTPAHRRAVKKSFSHNLKIEFNDDWENFYPILLDNKKKFNIPPTHSLDELLRLQELFPEDIRLLMAYDCNGKPIAGLVLFICNSEVVLTFYISHYFVFQELRAVNRLFYEAVVWSKNNNFSWLDLGVSMDTSSDNPMEPSRSLISFKEGIGTRGFLRSTYLKIL